MRHDFIIALTLYIVTAGSFVLSASPISQTLQTQMFIPIVQHDQVKAYMAFNISLQCQNAQDEPTIKAYLPRIRDSIITSAYGILHGLWGVEKNISQSQIILMIKSILTHQDISAPMPEIHIKNYKVIPVKIE